MATTAPGYHCMRPRSAATMAQILSGNGYATAAFGKMHQTPPWETSPIGPFDHWPTQEGFDHFYGFLGAETNQFRPNILEGTTPIDPAKGKGEDGYHLSEDLVDQAIAWVDGVKALNPNKPWFSYLSYGACHAPFQVPDEWRDKYRGKFSHGWDEERNRIFERQKRLGVIPEEAELTVRNSEVDAWGSLNESERLAAERLMELYAAFAEHTDFQTGRLIDALEISGELENTIVLYVLGDNGASAEGGHYGSMNEYAGNNGYPDNAEHIVSRLDELGGPLAYPHYPVGWALAMDTPYQWSKQVASHYGGTRNGLIAHWPHGIADSNAVRHQWHHCIDILPTILEAAGIPHPQMVDGAAQSPLEGTSLFYTFNDADAPDRHTTQYFEMFGNRGIYHKGWTAVTQHRVPWKTVDPASKTFKEDVWELYDTTTDWTQARDLALVYPDMLESLKELFLIEASRYGVFPLDDRGGALMNPIIAGRKDLMAGRTKLRLPPTLPGLREDAAPNFKNTSFTISVSIVSGLRDNGVLLSQGGRFGGWSLYIKDGVPAFCYNLCNLQRTQVRGVDPLSPGSHTVSLYFDYDGGGLGMGGQSTLSVDGVEVGSMRIEATTKFIFSLDETFDIGVDRGTPVTEEYGLSPENAFSGTIHFADISLGDDAVQLTQLELGLSALGIH